jgi:anaerobic ribonucleoside-triphosphate reductase activating protein
MSTPDTLTIRLQRRAAPISVLGPGQRAVIWVQGCLRGCPECLAPEARDPWEGEDAAVDEVAAWTHAFVGLEGITLTGGEPFLQAGPLAAMLDLACAGVDYGVICYTGHTLEELRKGPPAFRALLDRIDLLIDGPYLAEQHAPLRWRSSANQRLLPLTDRYRALLDELDDTSAGVQCFRDEDGTPWFAGIPPTRDFHARFLAETTVDSGDILAVRR